MSDVYSHGLCFVCHEMHDAKNLQATPSGKRLCPTCFGQYEDDVDPTLVKSAPEPPPPPPTATLT